MLRDLLIFIRKSLDHKLMKINIFADTICGWCFIGHANLNKALKKFPNIASGRKNFTYFENRIKKNLILTKKYLRNKNKI